MRYTIRQATNQDLEKVVALIQTVFPYEQPVLEKLKNGLHTKSRTSFIAEIDTAIVGFALVTTEALRDDFSTASFSTLAVEKKQRGYGIGTALVKAGLEALKERNFSGIISATAVTSHIGSQKILYSLGFRPHDIFLWEYAFPRNTLVTYSKIEGIVELPAVVCFLPAQYRSFLDTIVKPFFPVTYNEQEASPLSEDLPHWIKENQHHLSIRDVSLTYPNQSAPADISFLLQHGFYMSGVDIFPFPERPIVKLRMRQLPFPEPAIEKIQIDASARYIFDLVWQEYSDKTK